MKKYILLLFLLLISTPSLSDDEGKNTVSAATGLLYSNFRLSGNNFRDYVGGGYFIGVGYGQEYTYLKVMGLYDPANQGSINHYESLILSDGKFVLSSSIRNINAYTSDAHTFSVSDIYSSSKFGYFITFEPFALICDPKAIDNSIYLPKNGGFGVGVLASVFYDYGYLDIKDNLGKFKKEDARSLSLFQNFDGNSIHTTGVRLSPVFTYKFDSPTWDTFISCGLSFVFSKYTFGDIDLDSSLKVKNYEFFHFGSYDSFFVVGILKNNLFADIKLFLNGYSYDFNYDNEDSGVEIAYVIAQIEAGYQF